MANAVYTWYKRIVPNDSVIVGTGPSLYFPSLTLSDTGRYFCRIVVNNGCLTKYANYVLTGFCGFVLPAGEITLNGNRQPGGNKLSWNTGMADMRQYSLQRSSNNTAYETINNFTYTVNMPVEFMDKKPFAGNNYYRLKFTGFNNHIKYSNVVLIKNTAFNTSVYPNPVENKLFIAVKNATPKNYFVELSNMVGQKIMAKTYNNLQDGVIEYSRDPLTGPGIYSLTITDLQNKEKQTYKIVFK
jgi:hypothetical protein